MRAQLALPRAGVFALLALAALGGCGDDDGACGAPFDAPDGGLNATVGTETFAYGGFTWSAANDCPGGGPEVSVTIAGEQVAPAPGAPAGFVLCLPRPDLVTDAPIPLSDASRVLVVGIAADAAGCRTTVEQGASWAGSVSFSGFCTGGAHTHLMTVDGRVNGRRTCGAGEELVTLTLAGSAEVRPE